MDKKDVEKIASLARLELTDSEIERYSKQLSQILEYIDKLKEVKTDNVEITSQVTGLVNVFRGDNVRESDNVEDILNQSPEVDVDGGVKVKSVFN